VQAGALEVVAQALDARLVADRRVRELAARRLRRVGAALPVDVVEPLCLVVVGREVGVR